MWKNLIKKILKFILIFIFAWYITEYLCASAIYISLGILSFFPAYDFLRDEKLALELAESIAYTPFVIFAFYIFVPFFIFLIYRLLSRLNLFKKIKKHASFSVRRQAAKRDSQP